MKAIVVGSGGFLGRALMREFERRGDSAVGLSSGNATGIDPATGLFRTRPLFPADADVVFFVAQSPLTRAAATHADHLLAVNCVAAVQAALAAREAGIHRFIYTSTGNVYVPSYSPLAEDSPPRRDDWYSLSKVHGEEALTLLGQTLEVTAVRLFGVYGPGQTGRLVPNLIQSVADEREITLQPAPGEGAYTGGLRISLCHVEDVARILRDVAGLKGVPRLNVASEQVSDVRSIADAIAQVLGQRARLRVAHETRPFDLVADVGLLKKLLSPSFADLARGLRETVEAAQSR